MNTIENTTENTTVETVEETTVDKFTLDFVKSLDPKVKKVDSDGEISLYCYTTCDDTDPEYIKACRGLVYERDELILKAFSYSPDYTCEEYEKLVNVYPDTSNYTFFDSYEGALIRIFYSKPTGDDEGRWFISTHRRLDAFCSKWSSRTSFGEHLVESLEYEFSTTEGENSFRSRILNSPLEQTQPTAGILDKFLSTLDTNLQYMLLIQNNQENRIVCDAPQYPRVFHVGTFERGCGELKMDVNVNLPYPQRHTFKTLDEVFEYVENTVDCRNLQGVIMFTPNEQVKFVNSEYKYNFDLRGNQSSIKFRYLQLRMDPDRKNSFIELYPSHRDVFDQYEDAIYDIVVHIFNAYVNRYIHKRRITVPAEEYAVMQECHRWHVSDRSNNHISLERVMQAVNNQTPSKLNQMIKRYFNAFKQHEEQSEEGLKIEKTQVRNV